MSDATPSPAGELQVIRLRKSPRAPAASNAKQAPSQRVTRSRTLVSSPWVAPLLNLSELQNCYKENPWHKAAVDAKRDAVIGYELGLRPSRKLPKGRKPDDKQRDIAQAFLDNASMDGPLEDVLKPAWQDFENVGNFTIEVARNGLTGLPEHLFYVPSYQTRIHREKPMVRQRVGADTADFWLYGEPGRPEGMNEVLRGMQPNFISAYYGLPEHLTVIASIVGDLYARNFNLGRFGSKLLAPWAITFEGNIGAGVKEEIEDYFEEGLREGDFPKPLVLATGQVGAKVNWQRLNDAIEDASFVIYRKMNRDEILAVHRVPPNKVCLFAENKYQTSAEQAEQFRDDVVTPRQRLLEWHLNRMLRELAVTDWDISLPVADITEDKAEADRALIMARTGCCKRDEIRVVLKLDPLGKDAGGEELVAVASTKGPEQSVDAAGQPIGSLTADVTEPLKKTNHLLRAPVDRLRLLEDRITKSIGEHT